MTMAAQGSGVHASRGVARLGGCGQVGRDVIKWRRDAFVPLTVLWSSVHTVLYNTSMCTLFRGFTV